MQRYKERWFLHENLILKMVPIVLHTDGISDTQTNLYILVNPPNFLLKLDAML